MTIPTNRRMTFFLPRSVWINYQRTCVEKSTTPTELLRQFVLDPKLPPLRHVNVFLPSARDAQIHRDLKGLLALVRSRLAGTEETESLSVTNCNDEKYPVYLVRARLSDLEKDVDRFLVYNAGEPLRPDAVALPFRQRQRSKKHTGTKDRKQSSVRVPTDAKQRFQAACEERDTNGSEVIRTFVCGETFDFVRPSLITAESRCSSSSGDRLNSRIAETIHLLGKLGPDRNTAHTNELVVRQLETVLSKIGPILHLIVPVHGESRYF